MRSHLHFTCCSSAVTLLTVSVAHLHPWPWLLQLPSSPRRFSSMEEAVYTAVDKLKDVRRAQSL